MKIYSHTDSYITFTKQNGEELELLLPTADAPDNATVRFEELPNGNIVLGYLLQDDSGAGSPLEDDGAGRLLTYEHDRSRFFKALRLDQYGQPDLSPYLDEDELNAEVGDAHKAALAKWQATDNPMCHQCLWDTSRNAGVWMPDDYCREDILFRAAQRSLPERIEVGYAPHGNVINSIGYTLPDGTKQGGFKSYQEALQAGREALGLPQPDADKLRAETYKVAEEMARSLCEQYNSWCNGDVYGVVTVVYSPTGELVEEDSCWGYVGHEYAIDSRDENMKQLCLNAQRTES